MKKVLHPWKLAEVSIDTQPQIYAFAKNSFQIPNIPTPAIEIELTHNAMS